jgi:hypothetical protein
MLLTARSPSGRFGSFLASREDYDFVRGLSRAQRIVPVVGDFAGPQALRAIGAWVREHGLTVSAFYTSNVEFYLMRERTFRESSSPTCASCRAGRRACVIRACFSTTDARIRPDPGASQRAPAAGAAPLPRAFGAGAYASDWDVCTADYLH